MREGIETGYRLLRNEDSMQKQKHARAGLVKSSRKHYFVANPKKWRLALPLRPHIELYSVLVCCSCMLVKDILVLYIGNRCSLASHIVAACKYTKEGGKRQGVPHWSHMAVARRE